jgi:hypothetical protein
MNKMGRVKFWVAALICCCAAGAALPRISGAQNPEKKEILRQARRSYYQLRDEGLVEFQCSVTPNWDALLEDVRKSDPAGADRAVKTLSQLHFTVNLGKDGKVQITHNDLPGESKEMMAALHQIYGGMEQMTSGFFDTWSLFMLNPPFPAVDSEYQLDDLGGQYRLSYKEGTADVVTSMSKDFAISEMKVTTAVFASSIRPQLTKTSKGLLFSGYEADYQSSDPGETTHLSVQIDYQEVSGLQLLRKLGLSGTYGGSPFQIEVKFSGCQAKKR